MNEIINGLIDGLIDDFEKVDQALEKVCDASEEDIHEHFTTWSKRKNQMVHFNEVCGKLPSSRTSWQSDIDEEIKRYG